MDSFSWLGINGARLAMSPADKSVASIVRAGVEKACREFTVRIEPLGFSRTLKTFWTRRHLHTVDFIHLHRGGISYKATLNASVSLRVHLGIRVLNEDFTFAVLNGPNSDAGEFYSGRYHLRFNAETGSTYERCIDDLVRFVVDVGEPWFRRFGSVEHLLQSLDSPLTPEQKEFLRAAYDGKASADRVRGSLKVLGIKET
jgi:hypothetical protein